MSKTISSSKLRGDLKNVLNEVAYCREQYVVERFGKPSVAIISVEDLALLQEIKDKRAKVSLREILDAARARAQGIDPEELVDLIEAARSEFHSLSRTGDDV